MTKTEDIENLDTPEETPVEDLEASQETQSETPEVSEEAQVRSSRHVRGDSSCVRRPMHQLAL